MASAERWLFRMWQLNFFIILLLFVQQINTAEKSDPSTDAAKKVSSQAQTVTQAKDPENKTPVVLSTNPKGSKSDALKTSSVSPQTILTENAALSDKTDENTKAGPVQTTKDPSKDPPIETPRKDDTSAPKEPLKVPPHQTPPKDDPASLKDPVKTSETTLNNVSNVQKNISVDKESKSSTNPGENKLPTTQLSTKKPSDLPTKKQSETTTKITEIAPKKDPVDGDKQVPTDSEEESKLDFQLNTAVDQDTDLYGNGDDNEGDDENPDMKNEDTIQDPAGEDKNPGGKIVEPAKPQINRPSFAIGSDDFDSGDSHFFVYFLSVVGMCIIMYILFHNKQKILALIVEGRQERRRRPNTNQYRPLDNNLEEVIQSGGVKSGRLTTNIIY